MYCMSASVEPFSHTQLLLAEKQEIFQFAHLLPLDAIKRSVLLTGTSHILRQANLEAAFFSSAGRSSLIMVVSNLILPFLPSRELTYPLPARALLTPFPVLVGYVSSFLWGNYLLLEGSFLQWL